VRLTTPTPEEPHVNTCNLTIDHHPDTDQCGADMIHYAVHIEPIVDLPLVDPITKIMADRGLDTVVVLAPDYWDIEYAFWNDGRSPIAERLGELLRNLHRPQGYTAVLADLGTGFITYTTRKQSWDAQ
jgi:hypothetical protein